MYLDKENEYMFMWSSKYNFIAFEKLFIVIGFDS
jgi:hypothetical protein